MGNVKSNFEDNRAYNAGEGMHDSDNMIRQAGGDLGNDPRRVAVQVVIDRKISDHSMSGYNHNATNMQPANGGHENEIGYARMMDKKAMGMGTPHPDGTYSK
jgi:hypothetical protein